DFYGGKGYFTGNLLFSINGTQPDKTGYSYDGADVTEQEIGGPMFVPPLDSIQEFNVVSSLFNAEHGKSGALIHLVTKSGTNRFHGSLWEFNRYDALAAQNYFATTKSPLKRNQYGFTLG